METMNLDAGYIDLVVAHPPVKPRNRRELAELTTLLDSLGANEKKKSRAMERFIETLTALVMQYEEEIEPDPERSPVGVLKFLMAEHHLRQVDLLPIFGSKSYVSQVLAGHRPISKDAAHKLAELFHVSAYSFL
jgi:HTH-type transcriptional regulator/antitoxin HigA